MYNKRHVKMSKSDYTYVELQFIKSVLNVVDT